MKYIPKNDSYTALINEIKKESIVPIEEDNRAKNGLIRSSYWFNPVSFFQNQFNSIAQTHYDDYQQYRSTIQSLIDKQIRTLVIDTWEGVKVDKAQFLDYKKTLQEE